MSPQTTKHRSAKSRKHPKGLTLERFAAAKSSDYNKRDKREKQFALDARTVNKYRKLKQKLQQQGLLPEASQVKVVQEEAQLRRIQERAGSPAADSSDDVSDAHQAAHHMQDDDASVQQQQTSKRKLDPTAKEALIAQQRPSNKAAGVVKSKGPLHQQSNDANQQGKRHKRQKPESHLQKLAKQVQADKEAAMQEKQAAQKAAAERRARVAEMERQRKQQTSLLRKKTRSGQPVMKHRIDRLLETLQQ